MSRVYIAAGSNLGDRSQHLKTAFDSLCHTKSLRCIQQARVYETDPVGGPQQGAFLNTVWLFETPLDPQEVLKLLQEAERFQGRVRGEKNGPRVIDLDLAAYESVIFSQDGLNIPHERMHERWFVLKPFCDIAPEWRHPLLHKTAAELLNQLESADSGALYLAEQG